ncbi:transposase [Actinomadura viridis]|uniref:transposase n=1 Tax=Actinomadura viridis TaxID=58110 RepID=UPI00368BB7FF
MLAEIGDHQDWFAHARALETYAGSAPIARASGRSVSITRRSIKDNRLAATGFVWAFCAVSETGPARQNYGPIKSIPPAAAPWHHRRSHPWARRRTSRPTVHVPPIGI